jgi:uncharacterized protein YjbJ (UPF0337 family)
MNGDQIHSDWQHFKLRAKQHWGQLSSQDLDALAGKRDALAGKIIEAYAISKEEAEQQISDWQHRLAGNDAVPIIAQRSRAALTRH